MVGSSCTTLPARVPASSLAADLRLMARAKSARVPTPVPPLAAGRMPVTWVVRPTLPQVGAAPAPPARRALPVAVAVSRLRVVVPEA